MNIAKLIGKKGIWKALRWLLAKIAPHIFKIVRKAVNNAEAHKPSLDGSAKWKFVWNEVREAVDDWSDWKWLINLMIEVNVGDLIKGGKKRIWGIIEKL